MLEMNEIAKVSNDCLAGKEAEFISLHRDIVINGSNAVMYLVRMCQNLKAMNDRKLYEVAGYESFAEYTENAVGIKARQAYNYISLLDSYSSDFLEENAKIGVTKLLVLSKLGEQEAKEIIENGNAENMTVAELKKLIDEKDKKIKQLEIEAIKETDNEFEEREKELKQETSRLQAELDKAVQERESARSNYDKILSENNRIKSENKKLKDESKTVKNIEVDKPETLAALENSKKIIEEKDKEIEGLLKKMKVSADLGLAKFKIKFNDLQNVLGDINVILSELDEETKEKCRQALKQVVSEVA